MASGWPPACKYRKRPDLRPRGGQGAGAACQGGSSLAEHSRFVDPRATGSKKSRVGRRAGRPTRGDCTRVARGAAAPKPQQVELTLGPIPQSRSLDGRPEAFRFRPRQNRIVIPWDGPHTLEFRNDTCCNRKEVTVGPQPTVRRGSSLRQSRPQTRRLSVSLQPARADASILLREVSDGRPNPWRTTVRPGERVPVPFDVGDEMRKSLDVVVVLGDKTLTERVNITAGESRQVTCGWTSNVYAGIVVLLLFQAAPQTVSSPVADELRRGKISFDRGEYARAIEILRPCSTPRSAWSRRPDRASPPYAGSAEIFQGDNDSAAQEFRSSCSCSPTTVSIPCWIRPR